ncbi:MAG: type I asparaginase [Paludibacteraceae bacterium]|nr:type I asparaginase [Paludibacteraceae bacterium]
MSQQTAILLIVTGGTICMAQDPKSGALRPLDFERFNQSVTEGLRPLNLRVDSIPFNPLIDSSDVQPDLWKRIAEIIRENYRRYDGFVVLHGTDTMSFSASALSFMLEGLDKPVIFTGSQLPMGAMRSDAKENLLTSIEIAAAQQDGHPMVPEVCVFFEDELMRGNRTTKINAEHFDAFHSYNYPALAHAGVHIRYNEHAISRPDGSDTLRVHQQINPNIAILKLFPGITKQTVYSILNISGLRAVILETFGSGNAPQQFWLHNALKQATQRGLIIVNKTQCSGGSVEMGRYATSLNLVDAGVLSGQDITTEALVTKLMLLLGEYSDDVDRVRMLLQQNLRGEMTV